MRRAVHTITMLAGALVLAACRPARQAAVDAPREDALHAEISAMMAASARAWNRGDLDAFMADYSAGSRTTFVGSRGLLRGRDAIRAVYAPRFAPGGTRDSLSFEGLEVDPLAPDALHAVAYYVLSRGDSVTSRGPTSLIMRRESGRWVIVHDHSS